MASPCYVPDASTEGFQIIPVFDTEQPEQCELHGGFRVSFSNNCSNRVKFCLMFQLTDKYFNGESSNDAATQAMAYYTDELPLFHFRCAHQNVPFCRPDLSQSTTSSTKCATSETEVKSLFSIFIIIFF